MPNKKNHLAIDIGASGGKHIVKSIENGVVRYVEVYRFDNYMDSIDGHLVWDIDRLWEQIKKGIIEACKRFLFISTIGIDTWGVDYVLLNGDCEILPAFAYRDNRTTEACDFVDKVIKAEDLYAKTGCQFQPFNTIYQLISDKMTGRLEGATDFLLLPEYFYWKLTNKKIHEYTNATTTGMINAISQEYDPDIISLLGLPVHLFKKLTKPGHIEPISNELREELGTDADVILVATHDTASAVEGIDMPINSMYISSGTWSLLGVKLAQPILNPEARRLNFTNEGGIGYIRFQKNIMGLWIIQQLKKELNIDTFEKIVKMAQSSEYEEIFDVNSDSLLAPESMVTAIKEQLISNKRPLPIDENAIINSTLHSLAQSYKITIEEIERLTGKIYSAIHVFGGGAKNEYLNQLIRRYTNKEVMSYPIEASAIGNINIQENPSVD